MTSKTSWYFARLRSMSMGEIQYRFKKKLEQEIEKRKDKGNDQVSDIDLRKSEIWKQYLDGESFKVISHIEDKAKFVENYREQFPIDYQETIAHADTLLENNISIFNRNFSFGNEIPWQMDPISRNEWPNKHWTDIDIREGKTIGGVKWVWEINRHHHLVTLAKASFLTSNKKYATQGVCTLLDWIRNNPKNIGINWTSSLELSIRIINWVCFLSIIRYENILSSDDLIPIIKSIEQQAAYINRNLSRFSSANNHLIGEAAGLVIIGLCLNFLKDADSWVDSGFAILADQISDQVWEDGVPKEQAIHYLGFIIDFFVLTIMVASNYEINFPLQWWDKLLASFHFINQVIDDDGYVPALGDSDDGFVIRLSNRKEFNPYQSQLAHASIIYKLPDFKKTSMAWDEKSHWIFGEDGYRSYRDLSETTNRKKSAIFPSGGYCVMRSSECKLIFDFGPLGYLSTAAHGHADSLAVSLSLGNVPLLIDPGTFSYHENEDWRNYFRSTAAHNTIVVDGMNQSEMIGTFLWGQKANTKLLFWNSDSEYDIVIAEHDGYAGLRVNHKRTVYYKKPDWILIQDQITGKGVHDLEQLWHLPDDSLVDIKSDHLEVCTKSIKFFIIPLLPKKPEVNIIRGEELPIQGWVSPSYGKKVPAPVISITERRDLPVRFLTAINLNPNLLEDGLVHAATHKVVEEFMHIFSNSNHDHG